MNAINRNIELIAQKLRACTALPEYELWKSLCASAGERELFMRQVPIGGLIADIFCPARRLIIDVGEDSMEWAQVHCEDREAELLQLGLRRLVVHSSEIKESLAELVERIIRDLV